MSVVTAFSPYSLHSTFGTFFSLPHRPSGGDKKREREIFLLPLGVKTQFRKRGKNRRRRKKRKSRREEGRYRELRRRRRRKGPTDRPGSHKGLLLLLLFLLPSYGGIRRGKRGHADRISKRPSCKLFLFDLFPSHFPPEEVSLKFREPRPPR